jgi:hypothetical protein
MRMEVTVFDIPSWDYTFRLRPGYASRDKNHRSDKTLISDGGVHSQLDAVIVTAQNRKKMSRRCHLLSIRYPPGKLTIPTLEQPGHYSYC